jgi:hypothetical protein
MSNLPRLTDKVYTFIKTEHPGGKLDRRWFLTIDGRTIDARNDGHKSKSDVKRWAQDRELYCSENVTLKFMPTVSRPTPAVSYPPASA